MHIAIVVAVPDRRAEFLQQPIEALYTATILQQQGHQATLVDLRVSELTTAIPPTLRPDLFVLVTQTYDLTECHSISLNNSRRTVTTLRRTHPGIPVVVAGMHASMRPEMTVREIGCDAALPGELEGAVPWLVERLAEDPDALAKPLDGAPRFIDPVALPTPRFDLLDLSPYWSEFIDPEDNTVYRGTTGLLFANRGCPYTCTYCFVWFGQKIRKRNPEQVIAEMRAQAGMGIRHFFFLDYTFTISKPWVSELCAGLREADLGVNWICQTRCERVDPEILAEMKAAGCLGVFYGVESPWIGETALEKPTPRPLIEQTIEQTRAAGIHPMLFILFGTENDDETKAQELYDWLAGLECTFLTNALLPRPFTALWDECTKDMPEPKTWGEYAAIAEDLSENVFSSPKMRAIQARVHELPNYIGNRPRVGSALVSPI